MKEVLIAERPRYRWALTLENYVRQMVESMRVCGSRHAKGIPIYKLAHTRVRCRASQSAASRTSLGTRL